MLGLRSYKAQRGPGLLQGLLIEELDAAERDGGSRPGNLLLVSQIEKVLAQLFIAELVGAAVIMLGQLPDGASVSLLWFLPRVRAIAYPQASVAVTVTWL